MRPTDPVDLMRAVLGLGVIITFWTVPFSSLRCVPLPRVTRVSGLLFLATVVVSRAVATFGWHSAAFLLNDIVQLVAIVIFASTLDRTIRGVLDRIDENRCPATNNPTD